MRLQQLIDSPSIMGVFLGILITSFIVWEGGYHLGLWWQKRTPEEREGPTAMIVGSLLALMGFLLAVTMGMATERFDVRRAIILEEANSLGTTFLRAGYLPEPSSSEIRDLLREYVHLRIIPDDPTDLQARITRSAEIQSRLWSIAENLARTTSESEMLALFITSLNETIDLNESRMTAGIYARVPPTILLLLCLGAFLTLGMVGYNAGLRGRRSPLTTLVLIVILGSVITLVVDLDRSRDGLIKVGQQPLIDLQAQFEIHSPAK